MKKFLCILSLLLVFGIESLNCMAASRDLDDYYPRDFFCPIGLNVIRDAVQTEANITYDRENIEQWFATRRAQGLPLIDPFNKQVLQSNTLKKNYALQSAIDNYKPTARLQRVGEIFVETEAQRASADATRAKTEAQRADTDAIRAKTAEKFVDVVASAVSIVQEFAPRVVPLVQAFLDKTEKKTSSKIDPDPNVELQKHLEQNSWRSYVIYLYNTSKDDLEIVSGTSNLRSGEWCKFEDTLIQPPLTIKAGKMGFWASKSKASGGPKGGVTYKTKTGSTAFSINWINPIGGRNSHRVDPYMRNLGYDGDHATVHFFFE
jgi:predicted subunit of tRNA(5-methylaminomethyl-2-thiouridylate) methyltransferase